MNNEVFVIGADHHNTLDIVESLGEKGIKSYVLIGDENTNSFVFKSKYVIGSLEHKMSKEYKSDLASEMGLDVPRTKMVSDGEVPTDIEFLNITKGISSMEGSKKNIKIYKRREEQEEFLVHSDRCPGLKEIGCYEI